MFQHNDETKRRVAVAYVQLGSLRAAAATTGVNINTVLSWSKTPWWDELTRNIKVAIEAEFAADLSRILTIALDALLDRVEHGNITTNAKGVTRREPLSATELMRVIVNIERMRAQKQIVDDVHRGAGRLEAVADQLRRLGSISPEQRRVLLASQSGTVRTAADGDSIENSVGEGTQGGSA